MNKKILLIITGSVAAYKAVDLARLLQKKSYDVSCILTKAAQEFVTPLQVASVLNGKVYTELFSQDDVDGITHIKLSRDNDLILVAPASADFIAKMANGYGDDLASTVLLAANKPIIIAPAMNEKMWQNGATKENLLKLEKRGASIIKPLSDILACGEEGVGKMQEINFIASEIDDFFANQNKLAGKKILLTGGASREYIDPVRFIGNNSSGIQAIEIALALKQMGAEVNFIAANIFMQIPLEASQIKHVESGDEMFAAVKNQLQTSQYHAFIGCAAVADYKVENISKHKIKKETTQNLTLNLVKNEDILNYVGHAQNRPALVVGFAAESENLLENATKKLVQKNCDFIIANDVENGKIFGASESLAYLVEKNQITNLERISKKNLAKIIAAKICAYTISHF